MAEAQAQGDAPDEAAAAGKGGRKWLWLTIALFVLGGAGGGAYWYFAAAQGAHTPAKQPERGPPIYVALDPPFVVNFETGQLVRFLQVTVQLMTRDGPTGELLKANDPVIRNDLLMLFGNQRYADISNREGKEKLQREALDVVRRALVGAGGRAELVEAVYFTSFVMQ